MGSQSAGHMHCTQTLLPAVAGLLDTAHAVMHTHSRCAHTHNTHTPQVIKPVAATALAGMQEPCAPAHGTRHTPSPACPQAAIIARHAAPMTQPPGNQSPTACASPAALTAVPRTPHQHSKHTSKPASTSNTRVVSQWVCAASTYHTADHTSVAAQWVRPASAYDTHLLRPYVTQLGGPACPACPARTHCSHTRS
jgi:hypothetical protein